MPRRRRGELTFDPSGYSGYVKPVIIPQNRRPIRLYEPQREVVKQSLEILMKYGFVINTSETGTGKTLTTLGMINALIEFLKNKDFSVLAVGPPAAQKAWDNTIAKYLTVNYLGFISVDTLKNGGILPSIGAEILTRVKVKSGKGESYNYSATPVWEAICNKGVFLVFDEAHVAKGVSQRNAALAPLIKAVRNSENSYFALLSATLLDKSDSAMNFATMMGMVNRPWSRKEGGVDIFEGVNDFYSYCLSEFDYKNRTNKCVEVVLNTIETVETKFRNQVTLNNIRKYYNGRAEARKAMPNEGGSFIYKDGQYIIPETVDPKDPNRLIPLPVITKSNHRDFVADLFLDVIIDAAGVEIENTSIARMAYRGFFEVHPQKIHAMSSAIADFKSAAQQIISKVSSKSYGGAQGTDLAFGAVNVAIMHIEELMADTYIKLALEKLGQPAKQLPDGRWQYTRVVIALNYHSTLDAVEQALKSRGWGNFMLTYHGNIDHETRDTNIDKWNDQNDPNPYRIFLMTAATGGMSISLHDTVGTRHTTIYYSPDYQMIKAHQVMGRVFRSGQKSIGEGFVVYPKLDEQIDNIMLALARKSTYILRTRKYKSINPALLAEGSELTDVNFPGTYPRYIEHYGEQYVDEKRIERDCNSKVIPENECKFMKDNIVYYTNHGGKYAYTYIPTVPAIVEVDESVVVPDETPENTQKDPLIYKEGFVPGFVYLDGSPSLISRWGNVKNEDGKWVFTGTPLSSGESYSGMPFYMQPSASPFDYMSSFQPSYNIPIPSFGPPSSSSSSSSFPWDLPSQAVTPSFSSSSTWQPPGVPSFSSSSTWEPPGVPSFSSSSTWEPPGVPSFSSSSTWETPEVPSFSSYTTWKPSEVTSFSSSSSSSTWEPPVWEPSELDVPDDPSSSSSSVWQLPVWEQPTTPNTSLDEPPVEEFKSMSLSSLPYAPTEF